MNATTATHATVFPTIEILTDRVMNWFGFTYADQYPLRPYAMIVACAMHASGVTVESLTREDIESADAYTGGKLDAMFRAMH
jgi:hypothetical protein